MPLKRRRRALRVLTAGAGAAAARASRSVPVAGPIATAWLEAVESSLVPALRALVRRRLPGTQTRRVTFASGCVQAEIRQRAHHSQIATLHLPPADEAMWDTVRDVAACHGRWLAGLASGELDADLAAALVAAGLVPAPSELGGECSCRKEGRACVHTGLLGVIAARALSTEPEQVLVARGMPLDRIRGRVADRLRGTTGAETVDLAALDWDALVTSEPTAPPGAPAVPSRPGRATRPAEPPPAAGLTGDELVALAEDAAARALGVLVGGGDGGLDLDADSDLARRVAGLSGVEVARLAATLGVAPQELDALAAAWRLGGAGAVAALRRTWHPPPRLLEPGVTAMAAAHAGVTRRMNRLVAPDGRTELALGRDGLWYLLRRERRTAPLVPAAPGSPDPRSLVGARVVPETRGGALRPDAEQLRLL